MPTPESPAVLTPPLRPAMTTIRSDPRLVVSLAGAVLMVALVVTMSLRSFTQTEQAAEARRQTFVVLRSAADVIDALKDAETGQRGYILTGEDAYLEPYVAVRGAIPARVENLRRLTARRASQDVVEAIAPIIAEKMANIAHVLELRRRNGVAAALAAITEGEGKLSMDAIRGEMRSVIGLEETELTRLEAALQSSLGQLLVVLIGGSVLMLLFVGAFVYFLYQLEAQDVKNLVHSMTRQQLVAQEENARQLQQSNDRLRDSEERIAVTLSSIGDAVMVTDTAACVTSLNPVAEKLTGYTQAQAVGRPVAEIFHIISKDSRQPASIPVMAALAHGTVQGLANHTVLIARGGAEYDIADSCAPIRDRNQQVVGAVLVFRDVSKEYAIQHALNDSAALVKTIFNTVADGIVTIHALEGTIETANQAAEQVFGYTADQMKGTRIGVLIPEFATEHGSGLMEALSSGQVVRVDDLGREVVGRRQDGSEVPLEITVSEMVLGGQRYFTGLIRDITARKLAEAELIKAGALQSAIFNSANFSSIATDASGVIQIFNVGAERMLGYAAAEVMNKISPADISDPQEVITRAAVLSQAAGVTIAPGFEALVFKASRGIEDIYELTYIRKDGSRFPAVVSVTALRDARDGIIGYLLIGTDNTARKQVEEERTRLDERLHNQQVYTRSLIESNLDALMTTDARGVLTDVNKGMETLTRRSRQELIGTPFKDYFTDPGLAAEVITRALGASKITDYELTACAKNCKETVVSCNATTLYDHDGILLGVLATARDVTERKRWDAVLQENTMALEKAKTVAEKANLAKSDFLSSMSHELRSPLNAILGFAQLMESDSPLPSSSQKASIDQILHAGWYLLEMINEILDLAVIESGRLSISLEPVSLSNVMLECRAMIEPQAHKRGITMTFPNFDDRCFVHADRTRLKQVLINLLSNAIKYNMAEGSVIVDYVDVGPGRIRINVRDTGAGLTAENVAQLFQPFNRLGQEASGEEGTGIGLVVSRRLIELMQGSIGVHSVVGSGSVFWIEMLVDRDPNAGLIPAMPAAVADPLLTAASRPRLLLYVEDNPANMKLMEQLIARRPELRLLTAQNGKDGIAIARSALPDVILMDINLPGISGIDAMKILRSDATTAHIPIVALSANAIPRDIEKGLEAGFFRYLTKPIKVTEFMETLGVALAHNAGR